MTDHQHDFRSTWVCVCVATGHPSWVGCPNGYWLFRCASCAAPGYPIFDEAPYRREVKV